MFSSSFSSSVSQIQSNFFSFSSFFIISMSLSFRASILSYSQVKNIFLFCSSSSNISCFVSSKIFIKSSLSSSFSSFCFSSFSFWTKILFFSETSLSIKFPQTKSILSLKIFSKSLLVSLFSISSKI